MLRKRRGHGWGRGSRATAPKDVFRELPAVHPSLKKPCRDEVVGPLQDEFLKKPQVPGGVCCPRVLCGGSCVLEVAVSGGGDLPSQGHRVCTACLAPGTARMYPSSGQRLETQQGSFSDKAVEWIKAISWGGCCHPRGVVLSLADPESLSERPPPAPLFHCSVFLRVPVRAGGKST